MWLSSASQSFSRAARVYFCVAVLLLAVGGDVAFCFSELILTVVVLAPCHVLTTSRTNQVTLISGGGSGHEPAHAGYVGAGMLSAAVLGGQFVTLDR